MALLLDPEIKITSKMVADCAKGSLKKKVPDLRDSIHGFFEDHHRYQLQILLDIIDFLQPQINDITSRLENMMVPHQELLDRLIEVYGVEKTRCSIHTGPCWLHIGRICQ